MSSAKCLQETPLLPTKDTENTEPFLCKHAFLRLRYRKQIQTYVNNNNVDVNMPFITFLKKNNIDVLTIQHIARIKLIIIKKKSNYYSILFDGRFFDFVQKNWKLKIWILDKEGQFLREINKLSRAPKICQRIRKQTEKPLWKLLNLPQKRPNPQTRQDTVYFIKGYQKDQEVIVKFLYKSFCYHDTWHEPFPVSENAIVIEAFTKSNYTIGFRQIKIRKTKQKKQKEKKVKIETPIVPTQQNKSSCVSIKSSGLNLAFDLGLINVATLTFLSQQLSTTVGTLHLELDNEHKARYATYKDANCFFQIELKNVSSWNTLWQLIFKQKKICAEKKNEILKDLITTLEAFQTKLNSPYKKCVSSLYSCIKKFKVIIYAEVVTFEAV